MRLGFIENNSDGYGPIWEPTLNLRKADYTFEVDDKLARAWLSVYEDYNEAFTQIEDFVALQRGRSGAKQRKGMRTLKQMLQWADDYFSN